LPGWSRCRDCRAHRNARERSGRPSAAGRAFDEDAIVLAVVASVRHQDTRYDSLLMAGTPRDVARDQVRSDIDRVLAAWRMVGSRKGAAAHPR